MYQNKFRLISKYSELTLVKTTFLITFLAYYSKKMSQKFARGEEDKYSLDEKDEFSKLCKKYKEEYDAKVEECKKEVNWNDKIKKHTNKLLREGYLARAVREYYPDLQDLKHDHLVLAKALQLGKRCYDQVVKDENACYHQLNQHLDNQVDRCFCI